MTDASDKEQAEGSEETVDEAIEQAGVDPDPDNPNEAEAPTG